MYEILLPTHILLGLGSVFASLISIVNPKLSNQLFVGSVAGVTGTGVALMATGSSTLWVCVRFVALLAVSVILKYSLNSRFATAKN